MACSKLQDDLAAWTFGQLMVRLPFDLTQFAPRELAILCDNLACKVRGSASLYFIELLTTVSGLTRRARLDSGLDYEPLRSNLYLVSVANSGTGKTKVSSDICHIRDAFGTAAGLIQRVGFGTGPGVLRHIEQVVAAGGNCNLNADEGLHLLVQLLTHNGGQTTSNFAPDQALNSLWSGEELERQFANQPPVVVRNCYLNICASGTPTHYEKLRLYLATVHAQGGLSGRLLTVFSTVQTEPLFLRTQLTPAETGIMACSYGELIGLMAAATIVVGSELNENGGVVFQLAPAAKAFVHALQERICEEARVGAASLTTMSAEAAWLAATNEALFNDSYCKLRLVELSLKVAFNLHLLEQIISRIDFPHKQVINLPLERLLPVRCIRAGLAFVRFARRQQHFYDSMATRAVQPGKTGHPPTVIRHNCDFVLYACLAQLLLYWPGRVICSEMVNDRFRQAHVNFTHAAICAALATVGTERRIAPNARGQFACAGLLAHTGSARRHFRFYKFAPHAIAPEFFTRFEITEEDYSCRYAMDYMQIRHAGCWTAARGRRAFDDLHKLTPSWILTSALETHIIDCDNESDDEMARDAWAAEEADGVAGQLPRQSQFGNGCDVNGPRKQPKLGDEQDN